MDEIQEEPLKKEKKARTLIYRSIVIGFIVMVYVFFFIKMMFF